MRQALQENRTLYSVDWKIAKRGSNAIGFEYFRQRDTPAYVTRKLERQGKKLLASYGLILSWHLPALGQFSRPGTAELAEDTSALPLVPTPQAR